ncbi:MAG: globin domain-containing protein [Candidatus Anammoxibacter sp.]
MDKKFERLGGRKMLEVITKIFYDKIYDHPWLSLFFKNIKQEIIESQQVDFMQGFLGGKKVYCGQLPVQAHKHMLLQKTYLISGKLYFKTL